MANHDDEQQNRPMKREPELRETSRRDEPPTISTRPSLMERLRKKLDAIQRDDPNIYPLY
jgi:hypothetical protein